MHNTSQSPSGGYPTSGQPFGHFQGQYPGGSTTGHPAFYGLNPTGGYVTAHLHVGGYPPTQQVAYPVPQPTSNTPGHTRGYSGTYSQQSVGGCSSVQHLGTDHQPIQQTSNQPTQTTSHQSGNNGGYPVVHGHQQQVDGYPTAQPHAVGNTPAQHGGYSAAQPSHQAGNYEPVPYPSTQVAYNYLPMNPNDGYMPAPGINPPRFNYQGHYPGEGQGQGSVFILTADDAEWAARRVYLPRKHIVVLGVLQLLCGIASVVLNGTGFIVHATWYFIGTGFYCGGLAILVGAFGVAAGCRSGKCLLVTTTALSVILAILVWTQIIFAATAVANDNNDLVCLIRLHDNEESQPLRPYDYIGGAHDYECFRSRYDTSFSASIKKLASCVAIDVLLLVVGLLEFVVAVWSSGIGFRFVGCRGCIKCCCRCYRTADPATYMDILGSRYQQVMFQNDAQMVMFLNGSQIEYQGTENIMLPPYTPGAVGGHAMTSPPPYSRVVPAACGNSQPPATETTEPKDDDQQLLLFDELQHGDNSLI